jgi:hypothetical protein
MILSEFHSIVMEAMNLQGELAKADEREDDTISGWYKEFTGILRDNVNDIRRDEGEDVEDDDAD